MFKKKTKKIHSIKHLTVVEVEKLCSLYGLGLDDYTPNLDRHYNTTVTAAVYTQLQAYTTRRST